MSALTPSLYDLLDVEPTADDTEIRAAWKAAIAELDPSDRRFRAYNQAAEVLLDPTRRAAYDAELAAIAEPEPTDREETAEPARPAAPPVPVPGGPVPGGPEPAREPSPARRGIPTWLLLVVAALTMAVALTTAYVWTRPSDDGVEDATRAAQSAAERAVVPVLSYDATTLEEDQRAAQAYLTSDYRDDYDKLFEVIKQNAPTTGTRVDAEVISSGIVRSGQDRVSVLLFVNRPTTNKQQREPVVYKDQVTVTMQLVGDDWLVDDMLTSPVAN